VSLLHQGKGRTSEDSEGDKLAPAPDQDLKTNWIFQERILLNGNKEAQHMLFDRNTRWYAALSNVIPIANFQPCPHHPLSTQLNQSV